MRSCTREICDYQAMRKIDYTRSVGVATNTDQRADSNSLKPICEQCGLGCYSVLVAQGIKGGN